MFWGSNYYRLACQTLFTLWNAGRDYAPKCIIDGVNIQDYLQSHYFNAMSELGNAIRDAGDLLDECVIGWDSLNEPHQGYLETENLNEFGKNVVLKLGPMSTGIQSMRIAMGEKLEIENWKFSSTGSKRDGNIIIDPKGKRAWLDPEAEIEGSKWGWKRDPGWKLGSCIWAMHGVWDINSGELLIPDYFSKFRGDESIRKLEWLTDYWLPNWISWAKIVRSFHPEAIHFIQPPVFHVPPKIISDEVKNRAAYSSHFYDGLTLFTKHWVSLSSSEFFNLY